MQEDAASVAERYGRFARDEAPGRSEVYAAWAQGIAGDEETCRLLARIPARRRQPPLVFAVTRLRGVPVGGYDLWRAWLHRHIEEVVAECAVRSVQTNEPLRCAALLPALARIHGPIALLEVGVSAGLCLYPDRYSYRYHHESGVLSIDPADGPSPVVLDAAWRGSLPPLSAPPEIVWRGGIDLQPLDATADADRAWLTGLVWPGEEGRAARIRAALGIAAADPPRLRAGDAVEGFAGLAEEAAATGATVVVSTPGVLAHIPWAGRHAVIDHARAAGRWLTMDDPGLHEGWAQPIGADWPAGRFALAIDGEVLAAVDPLGAVVEWRTGNGVEPG